MTAKNEKIEALQHHINALIGEIDSINLKQQDLSAEEYLEKKALLNNLQNLRAIARNELNALLTQYRLTLTGKKVNNRGQLTEKVVRTRLFSVHDFKKTTLVNVLDNQEVLAPIFEKVKQDYAAMFAGGEFEIKRIRKIN